MSLYSRRSHRGIGLRTQSEPEEHQGGRRRLLRVSRQVEPADLQHHMETQREIEITLVNLSGGFTVVGIVQYRDVLREFISYLLTV